MTSPTDEIVKTQSNITYMPNKQKEQIEGATSLDEKLYNVIHIYSLIINKLSFRSKTM